LSFILDDFNLKNKVPNSTIEKYNNVVPNEIKHLWESYGFGTFMNDYFKAVNPDEYEDLLQTTSQRYKDGIVFFATSLGDLIIFSDNYVRILMYRYGKVKTIMYTFEFFFQNIFDSDFQSEDLLWKPYSEAVQKYGEPAYDECFGYVPLLGLGGPEKVENLQKVKLKEHILLISEFMGPIE